ncbi:type IV pilus assembly protein PilO [Clostridium aceticum]|uniref:Type IV pilus assembly protein PilO n=1 Tax=Clostridium aceticum TaxID=84022 RepID=A0A0D8IDR3_9CLOT|nr:hypothetical protein [Clostridium aceticum]AKL95280.1 type IV pilus assembly protein PilO [Clostridium aceticum]KJF28127.1 hypothetical protein TZ02_06180 [Clostridium aceticum]
MMLNRREKVLIGLLLGAVILGAYYRFLIMPLHTALDQVKLEKEETEVEYLVVQHKLDSQAQLSNQINDLNNEIARLAEGYFGSIEQEDVILLFSDFVLEKNMKVSSLSFSKSTLEDLNSVEEDQENPGEEQIKTEVLSVQMGFEGDYRGLIDFLKTVREYDKKIIVKNLKVNNRQQGPLSGSLSLDFYSVPEVNNYFPKENSILHYTSFSESDYEKIWSPLKVLDLFNGGGHVPWIAGGSAPKNLNTYNLGNKSLANEGLSSKELDALDVNESLRTRTLLYNFEGNNSFFAGVPRDIVGNASLFTTSLQGNYSTKVQYDFIRDRDYNAANLILEKESITIARQPEILAISVYAYETNYHNIGFILVDVSGGEFNVPLAYGVDWGGWRTIERTLPAGIVYPAKIQRIYIEQGETLDHLKGSFLFDKLEVLYASTSDYPK